VRKGRFWLAWILVGLFMKSLGQSCCGPCSILRGSQWFPSQDIAKAEANRRSAQASLSIAQNNYDRFKRLHDDSVINDVDFNSRRLELDRAREALKESEEKLSLLKAGSRYEQVMAAKAELERSEASLADSTH